MIAARCYGYQKYKQIQNYNKYIEEKKMSGHSSLLTDWHHDFHGE